MKSGKRYRLAFVSFAVLRSALGLVSHVKACAQFSNSRAASATFGNDLAGDRIYFPSVSSLSFSADQIAIARRGAPHPQLTCVGGAAADTNQVAFVDCYNVGLVESDSDHDSHGLVPLWSCIPSPAIQNVEISDPLITCEGYSYDGDRYVLRNSCYLTYCLEYCDSGLDSLSASVGVGQRDNGLTLVRRALMRGGMLVVVLACIVAVLMCLCTDSQQDDGRLHDERSSLLSRERS
jgi:SOCE-associated regulatory factor of calcium homoeostasis